MRIYGAGLAGLLAGTMLRRYKPLICEAQPSLPNNHDALLRFRSDVVSRVTGIPFKKVRVQKAISYKGRIRTSPCLKASNMYSVKSTGEVLSRSINNLDPVERYIAPPDLIQQLADGLDIRYNTPLLEPLEPQIEPVISTIPMPYLQKLSRWHSRPEFNYRTITTISADIVEPKTEVYQTIYYPGDERYYRVSITGNHLTIEMMGKIELNLHCAEDFIFEALKDFGINDPELSLVTIKTQSFGKITPIAEEPRKEFILAMSDLYKVYSVGRYATWRNILLDDLVQDIQKVEKLFTQRDNYAKRLAAANN
jgi:hypothetical protein